MMKNIKINRLGEFNIYDNTIEYFAPLNNYSNVNLTSEILNNQYENFLQSVNYDDSIFHANEFYERGKYLYFIFNLENTTMYSTIRYLDFEEQLKLFKSFINIAEFQDKNNVQVLWNEMNNFVISHEENDEKIKAILCEFGDFKVYDQTSSLNGVRRMILLGLTRLKSIIGKPNKTDFINKSDEVIKFAEEIINADSIKSIEISIDTRLEQFEQDRVEQEELLQEKQDKKKFKFKKSQTFIPPKLSNKEKLAMELGKTENVKSDKKKKPLNMKNITNYLLEKPYRVILLLLALALLFLAVEGISKSAGSKGQDEEKIVKELKQEKKVNNILTKYINGNEKEAREDMAVLDYDKLSNKNQKELYIKWLLDDKKYTKAISVNKDSAYLVGEMINKDNKEDIEKIATREKSSVLSFFLASYDKRYQEVINLSNKVDLKNKNVVSNIVKAYILTNQYSELDVFANKLKEKYDVNSKEIRNFNSIKSYYDTYSDPLKETQEKLAKEEDKLKEISNELTTVKKDKKKDKKLLEKKQKEYDEQKEVVSKLEKEQNEQIKKIESISAENIRGY